MIRRPVLSLSVLVLVLTLQIPPALAACRTHSYLYNGQFVTCTTCCYFGNCTTTCF